MTTPARTMLTLAAVATCGCASRKAPTPTQPSAPPAVAGRVVPAVVSGFERGVGGWTAVSAGARASASVVAGSASRGQRWLAVEAVSEGPIDVFVKMPAQDWTKFGDSLRADVKASGAGKAYARLYVAGPDGAEAQGPESAVGSSWSTIVWPAGGALAHVARLGIHWRREGNVERIGLDNVRVGAAAGLSQAYSVVYGPFPSREGAVKTMVTLQTSNVQAFPIYEDGWYLSLGTFRTRSAASAESARLSRRGLKTSVLLR